MVQLIHWVIVFIFVLIVSVTGMSREDALFQGVIDKYLLGRNEHLSDEA